MSGIIDLFQKLSNLSELIRWAGYFGLTAIVFAETGLLIGFFLPGDSLLVTAGLIAGQGHISIYRLVPLLTVAAICGNSLGYFIGRKSGPRIFSKDDSIFFNRKHAIRAREFYEKHGRKTIVLAQFMPIIRTFSPVTAGVAELEFRTFMTFNIIGAIAWIGSMLFTGYFLGRYIPGIGEHIEVVVLVVIFISVLPGIISTVRSRRKNAEISVAPVGSSELPE